MTKRAGLRSTYRRHALGGMALRSLCLLAFLLVVVGPLLSILLDTSESVPGQPGDALMLALPQGRRLALFGRSLGLAGAVALSGVVIGGAVALSLWRWRGGIGGLLRWAILPLVAVPPYVHALAWSSFMRLLEPLGSAPFHFTGWWASWWVQLMSLLPIAVGLTLIGFECVDPELISAARMQRPDDVCLTRVILPLAAPYLLSSAGLLFALSVLDYGIPSLYQTNVYALEVFAEYSASADATRALLASLPLMFLTVLVVGLSQSRLRHAATRPAWRIPAWQVRPDWPAWLRMAQQMAALLMLAQMAVPLVALATTVGGWHHLIEVVAQARSEIRFTTWIALGTAVLSLPLAGPVACELVRGGRRSTLWWILLTTQFAVPASLTGIGLVTLWRRLSPSLIYGGPMMPVLAALGRFAPWAALVLAAHMQRIDNSLLEAARVLQPSTLKGWIQVRIPLLAPGIIAGMGLVAVFSGSELAATLIVAPPGEATIVMRIYNYLHYGASDTVAGLCLLLALLALLGGLIAALTLGLWSRLYPGVNGR